MTEAWLPVAGWPYEVSDLGRVRRAAAGRCTWPGRVLRPKAIPSGYVQVCLSRPGAPQARFYIHRLVASAFVCGETEGREVAHLNGRRDDNRAINLAWCTHVENKSHEIMHGTRMWGERSGNAKLTTDAVIRIRREAARGVPKRDIRERFDISRSHLDSVLAGRFWKHIDIEGETS